MTATELNALLQLPAAERLVLIEKLWDSLVEHPEAVPVPDAHRQLLDQRLERPATGPHLTPDELTQRLRRGL